MEGVNYVQVVQYKPVEKSLYDKLEKLGLIPNEVRKDNVGKSDYSKHTIQPWSIWLDYDLNAWDADIVKRVLRTKDEPGMPYKESRIMDYNKIIHICKERIRQLESEPEITYCTSSISISNPPKYKEAATAKLKTAESEPSINYRLEGSELTAYQTFIREHHKECDGNVQVCFSNESGIGTSVRLYCPKCGTEVDITDVESW